MNRSDSLYHEKCSDKLIKLMEQAIADNEEAQPLMFVDLTALTKKVALWRKELPRVEPLYAVKCNPDKRIIEHFIQEGLGFDCASQQEFEMMINLKVAPENLIYANPCKMPSHIRAAKKHSIRLMTFDNVQELVKIKDIFPEAHLVLRLMTDDSNSICRFSSKFGAPYDHVPILLRKAAELGLEVVGTSFHVGSGCLSADQYTAAIKLSRQVFEQSKRFGFNFSVLDVGGGFPGSHNTFPYPSFQDIAAAIRAGLDAEYPESKYPDLRVIAEPGRFFVADSHTLAVCVYARRDCRLEELVEASELPTPAGFEPWNPALAEGGPELEAAEPEFLYYLSDGVYSSFNCLIFDHAQVVPCPMKDHSGEEAFKSVLFGPTCDSMDCICKNVLLPKLNVGEWIVFPEMGAYTTAAASRFNGFSVPINVYFDDFIIK